MRQVCLAVQHAHRKGIIHRDLKPSNILAASRDDAHDVKIIDFGIAKAIVADDHDTLVTREGQFVGTPNYMSPEQAGAIEADVDTRTDVYALGVVLYELLAGRRPHEFGRATPADIQRVFESTDAARPSTAVSGVQRLALPAGREAVEPPEGIAAARDSTPARLRRDLTGDLDNVVLKAIEKLPERRYLSLEQFADDLARFLDGRPVKARPATIQYQIRKFVQRHVLGVAVAGTALVFVAASVATVLIQSARLARERDRAIAAEQRARLEAEAASRTADFLSGVFTVNDPSEARGRSVTALELLDRSARDIGEGLSGQPALQSRLMVIMGNVYKQLGMYDSAKALLEQAVRVREQTPGTTAGDLANALDALGDTLRYAPERTRARDVLRRAVELQRSDASIPPEARASAINNLGLAYQELGEYASAGTLLAEALQIRRMVFDRIDNAALKAEAGDKLAGSLNNLGQLLTTTGKLRDGEALLRESLQLREEARVPRAMALTLTRTSLAMNLMRQARFAEAEPLLRQVVDDRVAMLGLQHPQTVAAISELSNALHDLGRLDEAEAGYRQVVAARATGQNVGDYAVALNNLGSLLEDRGRLADALPLFEKSLDLRKSVNGPQHPSVGTALHNLGRLNVSLGNYRKAGVLLDEALAIRRDRFGERSLPVATTQVARARLRHAQGLASEAEPLYREALEVLRENLSRTHTSVLAAEVAYGRLLVDMGRPAEGEPLLRHAVEVLATPPPPTAFAWRLAEARLWLGRAWIGVGRIADGRTLIRDAAPRVLASPLTHATVKAEARRSLRR